MTGLETAFAALHTHLVVPGVLTLETLLERMSTGPARAFGLVEPRIEVGARANLVALDLDAEWTVTEDGFRSLSANSWLLGQTLRGRVVKTDRRRTAGVRGVSVGYLVLEDGTVFRGRSVAADGVAFGEAVFTTGMTGYQETVTDPSYAGQLVCFTTAMVGNYGVADERDESAVPHAKAALMRACGGAEWAEWLREHGLVGLEGIDSRSLVLRLRDSGAMRAAVVSDESSLSVADALEQVRAQPAHGGPGARRRGLDARAATPSRETGSPHVAVVDYGAKRSIMRRLARAGAAVTVCPHTTSADELAHVRRRRPLERPR